MEADLSEQKYREWLGEKVREAGSQHALAQRLGVSQTYISQVLGGSRSPAKSLLEATKWERKTIYQRKHTPSKDNLSTPGDK